MFSEREQKPQQEGVGSELGCPLSAQRLCSELVVWQSSMRGKQRPGSWPAPHVSDCMQQVCTKRVICAGAHARTMKGSRQQDALLDFSRGAARCLMAPLRQMEGAVLGSSFRDLSFWQDLPSWMILVHSECLRPQFWSSFFTIGHECLFHSLLASPIPSFTLVLPISCSYNLFWLPKTDLSPWF